MKTLEEVGAYLRTRLAAYTTLATAVTSDAITEIDDAGDAVKQVLNGSDAPAPIVTVLDGPFSRARLTAQGSYAVFRFDVLLYFVNVPDESTLDAAALRARMSDLEKQVGEFVDAEGGNTSMWNYVAYGGEANTEQAKTLADILFAAKVIPLQITTYL